MGPSSSTKCVFCITLYVSQISSIGAAIHLQPTNATATVVSGAQHLSVASQAVHLTPIYSAVSYLFPRLRSSLINYTTINNLNGFNCNEEHGPSFASLRAASELPCTYSSAYMHYAMCHSRLVGYDNT